MELTQNRFKKTEIGSVPEDWKIYRVDDLLDLLTDYDANGSFNSVAENVNVYDHEQFAWYVRSTDLENDSDIGAVRYVDEKSYRFLKKTPLYGGELLFLKRGDIGKVYLFKSKTKYATLAPNLYLLKLNVKSFPAYLYYFFNSSLGQSQLRSKNASSTLGALYKDDVKSVIVPLPPTLTEQKAIATALSDVDALIASLDKLIEKKKAIKQGVMQELLTGRRRLAGYEKPWKTFLLGDKIGVNRGGSPRPIQDFITNSPNGINWIKIGDTDSTSKYIVSSKEKIIPEGVQFSRQVSSGDFLLSNSMSFGRPFILKIDGCVHDGWLVLQDYTETFSKEFLYYCLTSEAVYAEYLKKAAGSSVLNLNKELIKSVTVYIPEDKKEQEAIASILSDMDDEIDMLTAKLTKNEAIKQGMMQELLTGKTRLV